MKLLVGTTNPAKQNEIKRLLAILAKKHNIQVEVLFPSDVGPIEEPKETGNTIEKNSLLKAKHYFKKTGIPVIADDGAFEIDALGGAPGVQARYWVGPDLIDEKIIEKTLTQLKKFPDKKDRTARLRICLTYYDGKNAIQEIGSVEGYIAEKPTDRIHKGFPYRALLIIPELEKYFDDLSSEELKKYHHREKALKRLFKKIIDI